MQPAARIAAVIELLADIEDKMAARGAPADVLVNSFFRARRYAGSKDRRSITGHIYDILRSRALYLWALKECRMEPTARNLMLVHLARTEAESLSLFGLENPFAPTKLTLEEEELTGRVGRLKWAEAPMAAQTNVPDWVQGGFDLRFGGQQTEAAYALNQTAPLDIRINGIKAKGRTLNQILNNESELFEKNKFSDFGYRAGQAINLGGNKAYSDGFIEVQDEAAQVASALVDARPGQQVIDMCAGAGGKSLAMAAVMENKGQIHAFDVSSPRLASLKKRVQRAGVRNVQIHRIAPEGAGREIAFGPFAGKMDRVVVDAPCTGTGTWRRSPDLRWRYDADSLRDMAALQLSLLREGAAMVAPGGRLIFMTCSVLPDENEAVAEAFLKAAGAGWKALDYRAIWQETLQSSPADTLALDPAYLQLAPHSHATDGFFTAIFEREQ